MQTKNNKMALQLILTIMIIGLTAGMLSGLIGIGGGIILVPALVYFLHYNQHQAQGTSLGVLTFPVVILASLKYYIDLKKLGTPIDFRVIGFLAIGFIIGGFLGSSLAIRLDKELLKRIFAVVLFYTAFKMMAWDTALFNFFKRIF